MAYLPRVQECKNGCGASIYFDRDSKVSHPSQDKWVPLFYNQDSGVYTGEAHQCPNRKYTNGNNNDNDGLFLSHQARKQSLPHQGSTTVISEHSQLKIIADKLDIIIRMLEQQEQQK